MGERKDGRSLRYAHRREELLAAAADHVLEHGPNDLTLRRIAASAGVSHATLEHHFHTRDGLVAEIVERVLTVLFSAPEIVTLDSDPLRAMWAHALEPSGRRYVRLFVAVTGHAMYPSPITAAVERSIRHRTLLVAEVLVHEGWPEAESVPVATALLSMMRGLMVDLLVTGDEERVDAAFEWFLRGLRRQS